MKQKLISLLCALSLLLTACAAKAEKTASPAEKAEGTQAETVQVAVFVPDAQAEYLTGSYANVPAGKSLPEQLIAGLIQSGALPEGVAINECSFKTEEGSFTLDLNSAYLDAVASSGSAGETMLLYAVVDTFLFNYPSATSFVLTVDGQPIETEHGLYNAPFTEMEYLRQ